MSKLILHLTLKKKWFDQIARGEKKEEYRDYKPYWLKRLTEAHDMFGCEGFEITRKYDEIHFRNGYSKDRPFMRVEWKGQKIGLWDGKKVFAIQIGEILEIRNWGGWMILTSNRQRLTMIGVVPTDRVCRDFSNVKIGDKVMIDGNIEYFQDFVTLEHEFNMVVFMVDKIINNSLRLEAHGYGGKPYGNGLIMVSGGYLDKLLIVG